VAADARSCPRLPPLNLHGKEGVDGSSPSEGFTKTPQNATFHLMLHLHGLQPDRVWSTFWNTRSLDQRRTPRPETRITSLRESSSSATRCYRALFSMPCCDWKVPRLDRRSCPQSFPPQRRQVAFRKRARLPDRRRVEVTRKRGPVTGAGSPVSLRLAQSQPSWPRTARPRTAPATSVPAVCTLRPLSPNCDCHGWPARWTDERPSRSEGLPGPAAFRAPLDARSHRVAAP
jgi:hypothetical protein